MAGRKGRRSCGWPRLAVGRLTRVPGGHTDNREDRIKPVTRDDRIEARKAACIPSDMLRTRTAVPSECLVIRERHGIWETFYAERGLETGLSAYPTESAACCALLDEMRQYAAVSDITRARLTVRAAPMDGQSSRGDRN